MLQELRLRRMGPMPCLWSCAWPLQSFIIDKVGKLDSIMHNLMQKLQDDLGGGRLVAMGTALQERERHTTAGCAACRLQEDVLPTSPSLWQHFRSAGLPCMLWAVLHAVAHVSMLGLSQEVPLHVQPRPISLPRAASRR